MEKAPFRRGASAGRGVGAVRVGGSHAGECLSRDGIGQRGDVRRPGKQATSVGGVAERVPESDGLLAGGFGGLQALAQAAVGSARFRTGARRAPRGMGTPRLRASEIEFATEPTERPRRRAILRIGTLSIAMAITACAVPPT